MSFIWLRLEYALEGTSKLISWKDMMEFVLDDNGVLEYTQANILKLGTLDVQVLA